MLTENKSEREQREGACGLLVLLAQSEGTGGVCRFPVDKSKDLASQGALQVMPESGKT